MFAPFDEMWKLYFNYIVRTDNTFPLSSYHRVGFYGSHWSTLYHTNPSKFTTLFAAITGKALGINPEEIEITHISYDDGIVLGLHV